MPIVIDEQWLEQKLNFYLDLGFKLSSALVMALMDKPEISHSIVQAITRVMNDAKAKEMAR